MISSTRTSQCAFTFEKATDQSPKPLHYVCTSLEMLSLLLINWNVCILDLEIATVDRLLKISFKSRSCVWICLGLTST